MIKINTKEDPLLAKDFPNDPYSNLNIITTTQTFNLQQAFLAMDSQFFANINPDTHEVDLTQLKQQPLQKVLRSLYGEQLVANSVSELVQLYQIIKYLQIQDYKQNIAQEVVQKREILENLQFLELSFKQNLCWQKVLELHMQNKLKILQDSRNYLQLSKISNETFDYLLTSFIKRYGEAENKILNNVMQNYFNRKSIKPMSYLKNPNLSKLQVIWLKYHHVPHTELSIPNTSSIASSPSVYFDQISSKIQKELPLLKNNEYDEAVEYKRKRVIQLQKEIIYKDNIITELTQQIDQIKRQLGLKIEIPKAQTVKSLLIEDSNGERQKVSKKKKLQDLLGQRNKDNKSIESQQNKVQYKPKEMELLQSKPMHRLGSKNLKKY